MPPPSHTRQRMFATLSWLIPSCVAAVLAAPGLTGGDSGEYITAVTLLGNVHPPGNPTYQLLAGLFAWLPMGDLAFRINLFSAAALGLVGWLTQRAVWTLDDPVARWTDATATGVALFACFGTATLQMATVTEVYTLQTAWWVACLACLARPTRSTIRLGAFLVGLGLGVHYSLAILALPVLVTAGCLPSASGHRCGRARTVLESVGWMVLGSSVFAYLPLRSLAAPGIDPLGASNPGRLWSALSWHEYASRLSPVGRAAPYPNQLGWTLEAVVRQYPMPVPWLALASLSMAVGKPRWRRPVGLVLGATLAYAAVIAWAHNYPSKAFALAVAPKQLLPAVWGLGVLAAGGATAASRTAAARLIGARARIVSPTAVWGIALWALTLSWPASDRRDMTAVRDYHEQILWSLPTKTTYIVEADAYVYPLLAIRELEGQRPDLLLVEPGGRYLSPVPGRPDPATPVAVSAGSHPRQQDRVPSLWGLVYLDANPRPPPPHVWPLRTGKARPENLDYKTKLLLADSWFLPAVMEGRDPRPALKRGLSIAPENPWLHTLMGRAAQTYGDDNTAIEAFRRAIHLYPSLTAPWFGWGKLLYDRGRPNQALSVLTQGAQASAPTDPSYLFLQGNAANRAGQLEAAVTAYTRAIELGLRSAPIYYNRAVARAKMGNNQAAVDDLKTALVMDPDYLPAQNLETRLGGRKPTP